MKKIILLALSFFTIGFGLLNAQTNQGKVILGISSTLNLIGTGSDLMNLGYSSVKIKSDADGFEESDPDKKISFNFLPEIGYFLVDNLVVGIDLDITLSSTKDGLESETYSRTGLSIGPFIRYYIPTSKVLPYFEIGSSFGGISSKWDYSDNTTWEDVKYKTSVMLFGIGFGLASPLGERVMLDVLAGYNSQTIKRKDNNEDNLRTITGTFGLKLGFTIILGAK